VILLFKLGHLLYPDYIKGEHMINHNIRIKTDDDYSPIGDCEPYDQYVDDKLTGDEPYEN